MVELATQLIANPSDTAKFFGIEEISQAPEYFVKLAKDFETYIEEELVRLRDYRDQRDFLETLNTQLDKSLRGEFEFDCSLARSKEAQIVCIIAVAVVGIVVIGILIVDFFRRLLRNRYRADDRSRRAIRESTCERLHEMAPDRVFNHLRAMLRHTTAERDERAILRLLDCLGCDRVATEVWSGASGHERHTTWGEWILAKFHGRERERLLSWLYRCGILDFAMLDADRSRAFIETSDCATLSNLTPMQINQLITNLFRGDTGNRDERAILSVIHCLTCGQIAELVTLPGTSVADFQRNIQGSEWQQLRSRFEMCDIPV
jgi:hypothetical protein